MPHKRRKQWRIPPANKPKAKSKEKIEKDGQGQGQGHPVSSSSSSSSEKFGKDTKEVRGSVETKSVKRMNSASTAMTDDAGKFKRSCEDNDKSANVLSRHGVPILTSMNEVAACGSTCIVPEFTDFDKVTMANSTPVLSDLRSEESENEIEIDRPMHHDAHDESIMNSTETFKPNYNWDQSFVSTSSHGMQVQDLDEVYSSDFFKFYADESVRNRIFEQMGIESFGPLQIVTENLDPNPGFLQYGNIGLNVFEPDFNQGMEAEMESVCAFSSGNENIGGNAFESNFFPVMGHERLRPSPAESVSPNVNPGYLGIGDIGGNYLFTIPPGIGNIRSSEEFEANFNQLNEVERLSARPTVETRDDQSSTRFTLAGIHNADYNLNQSVVPRNKQQNSDELDEAMRVRSDLASSTPEPLNPNCEVDHQMFNNIWGEDHLFSSTGRPDEDGGVAAEPQKAEPSVGPADHPFSSTPISKQEGNSISGKKDVQLTRDSAPEFADVSAIQNEVAQTVGTLVQQVVADLKPCEKYLEEQFQELGLSLTQIEEPECEAGETAAFERNEAELFSGNLSSDNDGDLETQTEAFDFVIAGPVHNENDFDAHSEFASTVEPPTRLEVLQSKPTRWSNYDNLFDDEDLSGTSKPRRLSAVELNKGSKSIASIMPKCELKETKSEPAVDNIGKANADIPGSDNLDENNSPAESTKQGKKKTGLFRRFTRFIGKRVGGNHT